MSDLVTTLISYDTSVWPSEEGFTPFPVCSVHREQIASLYECDKFAESMVPKEKGCFVPNDHYQSFRRVYIDFLTFLQRGLYDRRAVLDFSNENLLRTSRTEMLGRLFPGQNYHDRFVERLGALNGPSLEELMVNRGLCQNSVLWRARGVHCSEYGTLQGAAPPPRAPRAAPVPPVAPVGGSQVRRFC